LLFGTAHILSVSAGAAEIRIQGSGIRPQLFFACDGDDGPVQTLFTDPAVIPALQDLHAGVALALPDLSSRRAEVVRRLNAAGVPVIAWLALPPEQGYYMNAGNAAQAAVRFTDFQKWTAEYGLRWSAVGLDIEPNLRDFSTAKKGSAGSVIATMVRRYFDAGRVTSARQAYSDLIRRIQASGYRVQTYQFPLIADERKVHSTLLERISGIVDVRGDDEVLMLYSSFSHGAGAALVWKYGPDAQTIAVGVTSGDPQPGFVPLNWDAFSKDLLVASHFTRTVGVYNLEGCVRRGFLTRLKTFDWSGRVSLRADSVSRVNRLRFLIQSALRTAPLVPYIFGVILAAVIWFMWRRRRGRRQIRKSAHLSA